AFGPPGCAHAAAPPFRSRFFNGLPARPATEPRHSPFLNPTPRDCPKPALFLRDSSPTRPKTHGDGFSANVPHHGCPRPTARDLRRERHRSRAILSALLPRPGALLPPAPPP